jgi:methionine-rich copper-binding protein CopC
LSFVLAIVLPGIVSAHAKIVSTVPADGDFVTSPETFVLNFDNTVRLTGMELHTIEGVSAEKRTREGEVLQLDFDPEESARSFTVEVPGLLSPGEYYLLWRCIASDSHFSTGEFFFTVISD